MNLSNSALIFGILSALGNTLLIFAAGFRVYMNIIRKLDRMHYAIFNDGNGMKQQVEDLHENQQEIKTDIALIKHQLEPKVKTRIKSV